MNFLHRILTGLALVVLPAGMAAHGFGISFERESGPYLIDAGCDVLRLLSQEPMYCSFTLIEGAGTLDWAIAPYETIDLQIRSQPENIIIDQQTLIAEPELMTFGTLTFPEDGEYAMHLKFLADSGALLLAQAEIPLEVGESDGWFTPKKIAAATGLVVLAMVGLFVVLRAVFRPRRR